MGDVSSEDLRNRTTELLRRVEGGERLRVDVNGRPVAELVPLERSQWISGAAMESLLREAPADAELLEDVAWIRSERIDPS